MFTFSIYTTNQQAIPNEANLAVQLTFTVDGCGVGSKGEKLITPTLITEHEVNVHFDRIAKSLEDARDAAKAKLSENRH